MLKKVAFLAFTACFALSSNTAQAQTNSRGNNAQNIATIPASMAKTQNTTSNKIIIKGNQRIEKATIISFMEISNDSPVNESDINRALNNLFATGLFADVAIKKDGSTLNVRIVENPIINQVAFEGNKRIDDDALIAEIRLKPRSVYTKSALQRDLKRALDIYKRSGRFSAIIEPKVIQLPQNRVNLVFEVNEGQKTEIANISFIGNQAFSDSRLRSVVQTKETRWYRFFSSDDTYDPDRVAFDKELLRRYYVSRGYADFRVISANAEISPEKDNFFLTYSIEEGRLYQFGEMNINSHLPDLQGDQLNSLLLTLPEETFNADKIEETVDELTKALGNLGYAFVKITPNYKRNPEEGTVGLDYIIEEGPRVYIESINISGNLRTMDNVIRREFRLEEGDPYNADLLKRSRQRINNLNFFQTADISTRQGSAPDKVIIDTEVEEKSTGELTFGAGFSTSDGALGDISLVERNLLGKGQFLKVNLTIASVRQQIDLGFTEPQFMDRNVAAGFDLFNIKQDNDNSLSSRTYDLDSLGGVLRSTYPITEHLSHTVKYSLRSDDITDVASTASLFVQKQAGKNTTSLVGHTLVYDKRDSRVRPTEGYFVRFNQDLAGLGGDAKFFRNEVRGAYYIPTINREWVFSLVGKTGYVFGYGSEDVRINDRFFIGGRDIRGFANDGLGPRDEATLDPLGGNAYVSTTAELSFPLGLPEELGFKGAIFTDAGTLFDVDDTDAVDPSTGVTSRVLDESSVRASVGFGVSWASPLGPIRIDISHAYAKETFDETEQLRFSFGTRF